MSKDLKIELSIQGMTGMGGEPKVVKALEGLEGVKEATASNAEKKAVVSYDPELVSFEDMKHALIKAGYVASLNGQLVRDTAKSNTLKTSEFNLDDLVCYCFKHTRRDIEQDYQKNGRSTIMAEIAAEKKVDGCDCANKNPKGRGCLADVRQVVDKLTGKKSFKMA